MENNVYSDRKSNYPNRRKLSIISQTPTEIIVDVTREEGVVESEGTPIDKSVFETWDAYVVESKNFSKTAKEKSETALSYISNLTVESESIDAEGMPSASITTDEVSKTKKLHFKLPKSKDAKSYNPRGNWSDIESYVNNSTRIDTFYYNNITYWTKCSAPIGTLPTNAMYFEIMADCMTFETDQSQIKQNGVASLGVRNTAVRADHVHPKDNSKIDKVVGAVNDDIALLNSNGNVIDSGKKISDFLTKTADESVAGIKTFTNAIKIEKGLAINSNPYNQVIDGASRTGVWTTYVDSVDGALVFNYETRVTVGNGGFSSVSV